MYRLFQFFSVIDVDVTYTPGEAGPDTGTLVIASDDPDESEVNVDLAGSGLDGYPFIRGDANAGGQIDIADTIFTLTYLFASGPSPTCLDAADANDDGTVDLSDAITILLHLFTLNRPLPEPFPECGIDETEDG